MSDAAVDRDRVVYDCNVLVQWLLSDAGPAAVCVGLALSGEVELFVTPHILNEFRSMPARPTPRRLGLTDERVESAIGRLMAACTFVSAVPALFVHPIDEKDSAYVDLAIAVDATLIVSRDKHLLNLTNPAKPWSDDFRRRFPAMRVLRPDEYLRERADASD